MDEFLFRYRAELVSVHDGDTVMLDLDLGLRVRVRVTARLYGPDPDGKAGLNAPGFAHKPPPAHKLIVH